MNNDENNAPPDDAPIYRRMVEAGRIVEEGVTDVTCVMDDGKRYPVQVELTAPWPTRFLWLRGLPAELEGPPARPGVKALEFTLEGKEQALAVEVRSSGRTPDGAWLCMTLKVVPEALWLFGKEQLRMRQPSA